MPIMENSRFGPSIYLEACVSLHVKGLKVQYSTVHRERERERAVEEENPYKNVQFYWHFKLNKCFQITKLLT